MNKFCIGCARAIPVGARNCFFCGVRQPATGRPEGKAVTGAHGAAGGPVLTPQAAPSPRPAAVAPTLPRAAPTPPAPPPAPDVSGELLGAVDSPVLDGPGFSGGGGDSGIGISSIEAALEQIAEQVAKAGRRAAPGAEAEARGRAPLDLVAARAGTPSPVPGLTEEDLLALAALEQSSELEVPASAPAVPVNELDVLSELEVPANAPVVPVSELDVLSELEVPAGAPVVPASAPVVPSAPAVPVSELEAQSELEALGEILSASKSTVIGALAPADHLPTVATAGGAASLPAPPPSAPPAQASSPWTVAGVRRAHRPESLPVKARPPERPVRPVWLDRIGWHLIDRSVMGIGGAILVLLFFLCSAPLLMSLQGVVLLLHQAILIGGFLLVGTAILPLPERARGALAAGLGAVALVLSVPGLTGFGWLHGMGLTVVFCMLPGSLLWWVRSAGAATAARVIAAAGVTLVVLLYLVPRQGAVPLVTALRLLGGGWPDALSSLLLLLPLVSALLSLLVFRQRAVQLGLWWSALTLLVGPAASITAGLVRADPMLVYLGMLALGAGAVVAVGLSCALTSPVDR